LGAVPTSTEPTAADRLARAQSIASTAALKAAAISGGLALPAGPLGMATVVPDLIAIWKLQAQMVADIASAYGKKAYLSKEQMLYCLFRHAAAQAVRDLVVRMGERLLIRRVPLRVFQNAANKVGIRVTQRVVAKSISRWLPIVGALGVGAYATTTPVRLPARPSSCSVARSTSKPNETVREFLNDAKNEILCKLR
jgi:hypothetical protein